MVNVSKRYMIAIFQALSSFVQPGVKHGVHEFTLVVKYVPLGASS